MKTFSEYIVELNTGSPIGLERSALPQIRFEDIPEFLNFIKQKGIQIKKTFTKVSMLLPTQNKIDPSKVIEKINSDKQEKPFIVSNDNYILDSHHQLYAIKAKTPNKLVVIYKIALPMQELINIAKSFPKVSYKSL